MNTLIRSVVVRPRACINENVDLIEKLVPLYKEKQLIWGYATRNPAPRRYCYQDFLKGLAYHVIIAVFRRVIPPSQVQNFSPG